MGQIVLNLMLCVSDRSPARSVLQRLGRYAREGSVNVSVVVSEDSYFHRFKEALGAQSGAVHISNEEKDDALLLDVIKQKDVEIILSIQYPWIFSDKIIEAVSGRAFNIHFGKLPDYRGHHLAVQAILNDESSFSTTCHWVHKDVDRGWLAFECTEPIETADTSIDLQNKAVAHTATLFSQLLDGFVQGGGVPRTRIEGEGKYYGIDLIQKQKEILDMNNPAEVDRKSRAFYFPPHEPAYFCLHGRKFYVIPKPSYDSAPN